MSSPSESEQRQLCSVFSKGLYCPKGKNCPLIHKWALCNAAKKVRRLAKLNNNHGDAGNKTCAKKHGNTSVDMPQAKNIKPGDSRNGTMVPIQDVEAQTPSAAEGEHQQPLKDVQFSKPGKSQHKNGGKKVSENVDHVQPANSADNSPKSMKDAKLFKLSNPSPNMSYGQHADEQTTKGKLLHSIPLRQQPNHVISINTPALSINTQRANSRWPKATNHRDSHANAPGARATQDIKNRNTCNDQATQLGDIRSVRMRYSGRVGLKPSLYEATDSKPLKWFTLFRELPFEIRLVIWKITIRFPYNPTVRLPSIFDDKGAIICHDIICQSLTPVVLRINRESRTEALKHYTLSLGESTYINKSTGTIFLDNNEPGELTPFVASIPQQELQTIESLAIRLQEWSWMDEEFKEAMWQFTNIKRLILMFSKSDDRYYLTAETWKEVRKELKKPESRDDWKVPIICLVSSDMVEGFLKSNTFA